MNKSHKGLLKRIKVTKSGKVRFHAPASRHLKSNKTGTAVQSFRKARYASAGDLGGYEKLLFRPLRSREKAAADAAAAAAAKCADAVGTAKCTAAKAVATATETRPSGTKTASTKRPRQGTSKE